MHRILDVKPEHESVIVDRIEAYVLKSLDRYFPNQPIANPPAKKQFAFSNEESTLITEPKSYTEEAITSNTERKVDAVTEAVNEVVSEFAKESKQRKSGSKEKENREDKPVPTAKILPIEKKKRKSKPKPPKSSKPKTDSNREKRREKRGTKRMQTQRAYQPPKPSYLNNINPLTAILLALLVIAFSILFYLIFT